MRPGSRRPRRGAAIVVKGRFRPKQTGVRVARQHLVAGRWRTMAVRTSSAGGRVRFGVPMPRRHTTVVIRLKGAATPGHPSLASRPLRIVVGDEE